MDNQKKIKYDEQYPNVGYYQRVNYVNDCDMTVIKFEEPNGKCYICREPSEWISKKYHTVVCSEYCLRKIKNEECERKSIGSVEKNVS